MRSHFLVLLSMWLSMSVIVNAVFFFVTDPRVTEFTSLDRVIAAASSGLPEFRIFGILHFKSAPTDIIPRMLFL